MKNAFLALLVTLSTALALSGSGSSKFTNLQEQQLGEILEEVRDKHDVPALAAAIVTADGEIVYEVVGVRKRGSSKKAERSDLFHLGSCTKPFTGWLAGWAVENGKLRWDSTLGEIFPRQSKRWKEEKRGITLAQLLTHRSGIEGDLPGGFDRWPKQKRPMVVGRDTAKQRIDLVEAFERDRLHSQPGTKFAYCNTNQILAAAMIEEATGTSWEDLLEQNLLQPLGIADAGQGPMGKTGPIDQPWQHEAKGNPVPPLPEADNPEVMGPAGRLHISMESWGKFALEILRGARGQGTLLSKQTYAELTTGDDECTKGSWFCSRDASGSTERLEHAGSNTMNHAFARIYSQKGFAVLVATNQGGAEDTPGMRACVELEDRLSNLLSEAEL